MKNTYFLHHRILTRPLFKAQKGTKSRLHFDLAYKSNKMRTPHFSTSFASVDQTGPICAFAAWAHSQFDSHLLAIDELENVIEKPGSEFRKRLLVSTISDYFSGGVPRSAWFYPDRLLWSITWQHNYVPMVLNFAGNSIRIKKGGPYVNFKSTSLISNHKVSLSCVGTRKVQVRSNLVSNQKLALMWNRATLIPVVRSKTALHLFIKQVDLDERADLVLT